MSEFDTVHLQGQMARIRKGDASARDELIRPAMRRLEALARKMLKSYPSVARWEDTCDVLQQALIRLTRALEEVDVTSTRDFFALAATQIRRELIDLARRYNGPEGVGKNHQSVAGKSDSGGEMVLEGTSPGRDEDLDRWIALHEAVESLPAEEREVFALSFYHEWTQPQIAELLSVNERTVRRWYLSGIQRLREKLQGELPG